MIPFALGSNLGIPASGHSIFRYVPCFGTYARTLAEADADSSAVPALDLSQPAHNGVDNTVVVAVNGAAGAVIELWSPFSDGNDYFVATQTTAKGNQILVFSGLPSLPYKVVATTINGATTLYAGGTI